MKFFIFIDNIRNIMHSTELPEQLAQVENMIGGKRRRRRGGKGKTAKRSKTSRRRRGGKGKTSKRSKTSRRRKSTKGRKH